MSTTRQTQHRAKRDGRRSRELAELKRSQHQLEAETRRLQEALARSDRPRVVKEQAAPKAPANNPCPQCGEQLRLVNLGRFEMWACAGCQWHTKKE